MVRGAGAFRAGLGVELRRTPGGMARGQRHQGLLLSGRPPMEGAWRPRAVSRQGTLEGRERAVVPFIEDTAAHTKACRDLGHRFPYGQEIRTPLVTSGYASAMPHSVSC